MKQVPEPGSLYYNYLTKQMVAIEYAHSGIVYYSTIFVPDTVHTCMSLSRFDSCCYSLDEIDVLITKNIILANKY